MEGNIITFPSEYVKKSGNVYKPANKIIEVDQKIIKTTNELIQILKEAGFSYSEQKEIFKFGNEVFNKND